MSLEIFNCEQGTPEWYACRLGIPTASEFKTLMAERGPRGGETKEFKTRRTYMYKLVGERITGQPKYDYHNDHMDRGKEMEDEARDLYVMLTELDVERVGFIRRGNAGCSPDSLIGNDGMLEIKTKLPHLQIDVILTDELPSEHRAQCQGQLWIAEREWVDFVSYWPGLPLFAKRVFRDEDYIKKLAEAVRVFNEELEQTMAKIQQYRRAA